MIACASDWLQGPYIYKLYADYDFKAVEIGYLFSAGYVSSLIFGTYIGGAADHYGRKRSALRKNYTIYLELLNSTVSKY